MPQIRRILYWICVPALVSAGLPTGPGTYIFNDQATGNAVRIWYFKPDRTAPGQPVVFVLHGVNRNADDYRDKWIKIARDHNFLLVVPEFSDSLYRDVNGYNLGNIFAAETREELEGLAFSWIRNDPKLWSFRLIERVFDGLLERDEASGPRYYIFGHSAGSQFVQRMLLFVPEARVEMAIIANAGWYTLPDTSISWPYGLQGTGTSSEAIASFLSLPVVVMLGEKDNNPDARNLRRTPEAMLQGRHRFERGIFFHQQAQKLAGQMQLDFNWRLVTVPGVGHNYDKMAVHAGDAIARYIKGHPDQP